LLSAALMVSVAVAIPTTTTKRAFEGESVIRAKLDTDLKREFVDTLGLDVWKDIPGSYSDIRVSSKVMDLFKQQNIDFDIYIDDLATLIEESTARRENYKGTLDVYFEEYHTYAEQVAYYNDLCNQYGSRCSRVAVGQSDQGQTQYQYTIDANKPRAVFMDAGIHAREWISSTTLQYIFTQVLTAPTNATNQFTWIFHGHQNPDGYIFSWSNPNNRLWRKSRNVNQGSTCIGTDLNRNWPTATWGGPGSSPSPCSDTYHGSSAGSEPEVQNLIPYFGAAVRNYDLPVAITLHSYSQLLLRQYGHTQQNSPDEVGQRNLGALMVEAIHDTHGLEYENIKSIELYATTGTTGDWYYGNSTATSIGTATYGYTFELRDTGRYGFVLPEEQIIPQGEEIWNSLLAMCADIV